ncbi:glycosyltransferase family protein [Pseudooctadecabacter jejudonensis]|uniref:Polysaccharide pyruvyl transferase n=1 Tax=Pseudooctadecabacter jejudonensis TaxID=1391910 RepID=A0A1Y5SQU4_9RHOB|nr:polysaccharide pyruvyl transferase family protein [Pseudooctadecabacter jejudonensis]SLN43159.1 Polysaccharide pyruvyl transferase [Pseudooctadecabacter jejudonensis]
MTARVVLLNDTDVNGYHFGCARVMGVIRRQLADRGLAPIGSVPVSLNWQDAHADLVNSADLLVINGEGTLHHASRKGRWLLDAAKATKARGARVALINALWQDNPEDWAELIASVDILSVRDSRSAAAMARQTGRSDIRVMGDLSMCVPLGRAHTSRSGVLVGDSLHASVTARLAQVAGTMPEASLVPVTSSLKFISPHKRGLRRALRIWYAGLRQRQYLRQNPKAQFLPDEAAYVAHVQTKALSVTGRFHAACLAVATRTPFVAVRSNSWKIEALLEDVGLSADRLLSVDALTADRLTPDAWAFSTSEAQAIEAKLAEWAGAASQLFDDIAALVPAPDPRPAASVSLDTRAPTSEK